MVTEVSYNVTTVNTYMEKGTGGRVPKPIFIYKNSKKKKEQ